MAEQAPQSEKKAPRRPMRTGKVHKVSGSKTISVVIEHLRKDPRYGKYLRRQSKLAVHDPKNEAKPGDLVEIVSCRPLSRRKSWRLVRVVRPAVLTEAPPERGI